MTLATHAIIGAALATAIPEHPVAAFTAGFASHFIIDAIPHWDYPIWSDSVNPQVAAPVRLDRALVLDAVSIGFDALAGLAVSVLAFGEPGAFAAVLAGAAGGILPDPLQFVTSRFPHEPLLSLQRFHMWIHTKRRLRTEGRHFTGISSQILFVIAVIALAKFLF